MRQITYQSNGHKHTQKILSSNCLQVFPQHSFHQHIKKKSLVLG